MKVSEHQEFVRSIVTDIPDRDGQIYGKDNFSIGSLYHLPEISYISLPKIGGYAISCQSEYFTRYSDAINQSDWRWHSELFVLQDGDYVHSKRNKRSKIIDEFRAGKIRYLVTTAVLERGVTIKDLQVIVFMADHAIYDSHTLIQISGRVGRKKDAPTGKVSYICSEITGHMKKSIEEIKHANASV